MKTITKKTADYSTFFIFLILTIFAFIFNPVNAETVARNSNASAASIELDNLVKTRLPNKIYVVENINDLKMKELNDNDIDDLAIEEQNQGISICIGVDSCNGFIAYCVDSQESDPSCTYNDEGQPIGCVC